MELTPRSPRALAIAVAALLAAAPSARGQLPPVLPPPPPEQQPPPPQPATPPPGPSQPSAPAQLRGVQLHPLWDGVTSADSDRQLRIARDAGATVVRADMEWSSLEFAGPGRLNEAYVRRADAFMRLASRAGLPVVLTLSGTPCWASTAPASLTLGCRGTWWRRGVKVYPPVRARDYGRIAAWTAARWRGQLAALEVWNEPNQRFFFASRDPARAYGRLLRAAYRPVKRAAPGVRVLAGAIAYSDGDFLTALYERGRIGGSYDAISYHPYTDGRDPRAPASGPDDVKRSFVDGTAWMRNVMAAHEDGSELWATEAGASTCAGGPPCVDEATQADHVRGYLQTAAGMSYLRSVIVYSLRDSRTPASQPSGRFGLLRYDLRPKPAFAAFREALAR
jgi:hypothetical protein